MSRNRDSIRDFAPESQKAPPAPEAPAPKMSVEDALAVLAQHNIAMSAAIAGMAGDREAQLKTTREEDERLEICKREAGKPAQQRTQERADAKWPKRSDDQRYKVALMSYRRVANENGIHQNKLIFDMAFPVVEINAASQEEAKARYENICGILSVDAEKSVIRIFNADEKLASLPARTVDDEDRMPAGVIEVGVG